jgi:predicted MFS family arabinose efflux permease
MTEKEALVPKAKSARAVFGAVTLSHMSQHFSYNATILNPQIMKDLNLNYTELGLITGLSSFIAIPLQIAMSIIPRYVTRNLLMCIGNILSSFSCFFTSLANNFQILLGARVVGSIGSTGHDSLATSMLSDKYDREHLSGALSTHWSFTYVSSMIGPIVLTAMAVFLGWRQALALFAIIPFAIGLLVFLYLKGDKSGSKTAKTEKDSNLWGDVKSAFQNRNAIFIIIASVFIFGGPTQSVISTYMPLFLQNALGVGSFETSIVYSTSMLGGILGTMFFGRISLKIGSLKTLILLMGSGSILDLLLMVYTSFSIVLGIHLFFMGFTSYAGMSLLQAHVATIARTPRQRDITVGLLFTLSYTTSPIISIIAGFLIDVYSFNAVWIFKALLGTIAFGILILALWESVRAIRARD